MENFICVSKCSSGHYEADRICSGIFWLIVECHGNCKECDNGGVTGCSDCNPGTFLWNGECRSDCPEGFYLDSTHADHCLPCPSGCKDCLSEDKCVECLSGSFMIGDSCVLQCPAGTYANELVQSCLECDEACINCYGPTQFSCSGCNYEAGYIPTSGNNCYLISCAEGFYTSISTEDKSINCLPCDSSCKTCEGPMNCTSCNKGLVLLLDNVCSACSTGFKMKADGKCAGNLSYYSNRDMWRW